MKELQDIVALFEQSDGRPTALATIVQTQGSTYRQAGARLLMTIDGQMVGSLSAGCLEQDVFEHAQAAIASGQAALVTYDSLSHEDVIWGLGLGCNGKVQILIEPLLSECNLIALMAKCLRRQQVGVIATVFQSDAPLEVAIGSALLLDVDGLTSTIADAELLAEVHKDSQIALTELRSSVKTYAIASGEVQVFIDVIQPPVPLIIFGANPDAVPVVQLAKAIGWHVTIADHRSAYATVDRFPAADAVVCCRPQQIREFLTLDARTIAVIMTHNYTQDQALLEILLPLSLRYLGILGPKRRTARLLQDLQAETEIDRLYAPVGLDIGANTPEEIALSIVAEMQAAIADRSGSNLRDRAAPIHHHSEPIQCLPLA